jgi:hypothetical protein
MTIKSSSVSTSPSSSLYTAPQEVVGPQGAMGLAMAEEDSRHTE